MGRVSPSSCEGTKTTSFRRPSAPTASASSPRREATKTARVVECRGDRPDPRSERPRGSWPLRRPSSPDGKPHRHRVNFDKTLAAGVDGAEGTDQTRPRPARPRGSSLFARPSAPTASASSPHPLDKTARVLERRLSRDWPAPRPARSRGSGRFRKRPSSPDGKRASSARHTTRRCGCGSAEGGRPDLRPPRPRGQCLVSGLQPRRQAHRHRVLGQDGAGVERRGDRPDPRPARPRVCALSAAFQPRRQAHRDSVKRQDSAGVERRGGLPAGPSSCEATRIVSLRRRFSPATASSSSPHPLGRRRHGCWSAEGTMARPSSCEATRMVSLR